MEYKPNMYVKNILVINYKKLKELGITTLFFDFDNTLIERHNYIINKKYEYLLSKLKKKFNVMVVSNSLYTKKVKKVCSKYNLSYIYFACKPFSFGFKKAQKKLNCSNGSICVIGDQIFTDIKGAKKLNYYSILIDPINYDENCFTRINRRKERKTFKRGNYYE